MNENFKEGEPSHVFAIAEDFNGVSLKGLLEGPKFDAKHWNQFRKFAISSEKKWIETLLKLGIMNYARLYHKTFQ